MELLYEDEILPEIEIRELLTLEQVLDNNPSFVAFTRREIEDRLYDLLKDDATAATLTSEIYRIVNREDNNTHAHQVVPILKADKKTFFPEDDEDDTGDSEYFRVLEDIKNAPNYNAQQALLNQLTYPLEHRPPMDGEAAFHPRGKSTLVGISSSLNMSTVLLPYDNAPEALAGAAFLPANVTPESFLNERVETPSLHPLLTTATFQHTTDLSAVRPTFDSVIRLIKSSDLDLHRLRHRLLQYGYSLDTLSTPQLSSLIDHLRGLHADAEAEASSHEARGAAARSWQRNWRDFFDALKQLPVRGLDKEKYNTIYNAIAAGTPPIQTPATLDIPFDNGRILEGIRTNTFTIDEVATFLKMTRNKIIIDNAFGVIQRYMEIDPDAIPENIESIIKKWTRRYASYDDRTASTFLELYRDMSEIKKGTDTSMYDGNPNEQPQQVFEELRYAESVAMEVEENDIDDDINVDDLFGTDFDTSAFSHLTLGVREVIIPVTRKLHALSQASGVPLSIPKLLSYMAPRIVRVSFAESIQQNIPELAANVRLQLASGNFESAIRVASNILPTSLGERAQEVVRLLYKDYQNIVVSTFLECFAWFVIDTQTASLEKRLEFEPRYGMMSCMKLWGPYGAPLTKEKEKVGVLYYLASVAQESGILGEYRTTHDQFAQDVLSFIADNMSDKVMELQDKHKDMLKEAMYTVSRAQQAKISLDYAIKEKSKQKLITEFVRSFLYLPGVSKTPRYMQLGPTFTSESDWQDMTKLKTLKDQLAKKRMTKIKRPELAWIETKTPPVAHVIDIQLPPSLDVGQPQSTSSLRPWLEECRDANLFLLPPDVVNALLTDPTTLNTHITKNTSAFGKTIGKPAKLDIGAEPKLLDVVATSLYSSGIDIAIEDVEHQHIEMSMDAICSFKAMWSKIRNVMILDSIDGAIMSTMWRYVLSRAVCLPCDSKDANGRTGKLSIGDNVRVNFVQRVLTRTMSALTSALNNAKMPTAEEQHAFITKMREIQKVQTLQVLNNQTEDERLMTLDAKKLGLYKMNIDYGVINADLDEIHEDVEAEGEAEFAYEGEDPEMDEEQI